MDNPKIQIHRTQNVHVKSGYLLSAKVGILCVIL